jgi:hypothetical protein
MKVQFCDLPGCKEKKLPLWANWTYVFIGSFATTLLAFGRHFGSIDNVQSALFNFELFWLPNVLLLTVVAATLILALFERFENPLVAVLYGSSMPSLLYAITTATLP